ncbi:ester cyclase [Natrinema sp. SYSU A 869]|uniref:ester cyclase n=1 Tax=Natrinema sp. SYSU A 869 TaxID=2871694 RepID=UPI0021041070|nr:ester cyclase [Natrinema sp. SYSU A 869]
MVKDMALTTTPEENKQIIHRFVEEVVNNGNYDRIDELVAEDLIDQTPFGETRGRDALRDTMTQIRTAFPDFSVTSHEIVAEGDSVAVRMNQRGTHEGEFMSLEPTGRTFDIEAMGFARLEDGQIAERWAQPDMLGLLQQLGVVESPGE